MPEQDRMPVLFVGHGNPMNAVEDNTWSRGFQHLAALVPEPKAILSISAHWYRDRTLVSSMDKPRTIHDFGGFPDALYEIQYPVSGDINLATKVVEILGEKHVSLNEQWGIDHGSWSVLRKMYPKADHPVVQLSINYQLNPEEHYKLGLSLAALRKEGYLIFGSGNITHNLGYAFSHSYRGDTHIPDWAMEFDEKVKSALVHQQHEILLTILDTDLGNMAHPTADHYLPVLYIAGCADHSDKVTFPIEGFDMGSLSMRAFIISD